MIHKQIDHNILHVLLSEIIIAINGKLQIWSLLHYD